MTKFTVEALQFMSGSKWPGNPIYQDMDGEWRVRFDQIRIDKAGVHFYYHTKEMAYQLFDHGVRLDAGDTVTIHSIEGSQGMSFSSV